MATAPRIAMLHSRLAGNSSKKKRGHVTARGIRKQRAPPVCSNSQPKFGAWLFLLWKVRRRPTVLLVGSQQTPLISSSKDCVYVETTECSEGRCERDSNTVRHFLLIFTRVNSPLLLPTIITFDCVCIAGRRGKQ